MASGFPHSLRQRGFTGVLRQSEPLHRHTSLGVGGPAALYAEPFSLEDVALLIGYLADEGLPWVVLGGGTNMVFVNGGYGGCVVRLGKSFAAVTREGERTLAAGAAADLPGLLSRSAREGLSGLECLAGIPGTVGGALSMNAGTRIGEIGDVVREAQLHDGRKARWVPRKDLGLGYRKSEIPEGEIILGTRLDLTPASPEDVRARIRELVRNRRKSQPAGVKSAGCWFRNPEGDSAGRLIDAAGMKGRKRGGAHVSEVHANFFINTGGATAADFIGLAREVRDAVREQFGVLLQEEVKIIHG